MGGGVFTFIGAFDLLKGSTDWPWYLGFIVFGAILAGVGYLIRPAAGLNIEPVSKYKRASQRQRPGLGSAFDTPFTSGFRGKRCGACELRRLVLFRVGW